MNKPRPSSSQSPLLPAETRARIDRLARRFQWGFSSRSPLPGQHRGRRLGTAGEFEGYRRYEPGDDLARLDVGVYARLRQRVVRLSREDSILPLTVLIDRSASMAGTHRERAMTELAAFFLQVARRGHDPVRLFAFSNGQLSASPGRLQSIESLETLLRHHPLRGDSNFAREFAQLGPDPAGPGVVIVLSDGFGIAEPERELAPLLEAGRTYWLALLEPDELDPPEQGRVRLVPRESGPTWQGDLDPSSLSRYRSQLRRYHDGLRGPLRERGGDFVVLRTSASIAELVGRVHGGGGALR